MAFSFEASHGTTFLYNKGLAGNVTIIGGDGQVTVPGTDLTEFVADVTGAPPAARPPARARAAGSEAGD
jgi:hypothetical protein